MLRGLAGPLAATQLPDVLREDRGEGVSLEFLGLGEGVVRDTGADEEGAK